jgi:hypothetical protein
MHDKKKSKGSRFKKEKILPYTRENTVLLVAGLATVVAGYVALSKGPWNSFWSLTLAPILLVVGYCVIIPFALIFQKKKPAQAVQKQVQQVQPEQQAPTQ